MAQRSVPAPFLTKTYLLVDDPATDDIVSWNEAGTAFVVWKTAEFAQDLLPTYFKHNNFSSFVRQLNTYGFRKIVPDKWEFSNESFKRGEKDLLTGIRRRKTSSAQKSIAAKRVPADHSPETSGEDLGSSSTSSPDSKNPSSSETDASAQLADLSGENEKLRKDNQMLSSELAQTRRQCDELIAFLNRCANVAPDDIHRIMQSDDGGEACGGGMSDPDDDEKGNCVKLFGVIVKRKRGCSENSEISGVQEKKMKRSVPCWMKISASPGEHSKVCN